MCESVCESLPKTAAPAASNGPSPGPAPDVAPPAPEAPEAPAGAPEANVGQPGPPLPPLAPSRTPWLSPVDGPLIQSDVQPIRLCPNCHTPVPLDALSCSRCGRFAPENKPTRKRLKKTDVDALIAKVKADYQPSNTIEHHACENLGLTLAELKSARPGSPDHQRLLSAVQTITSVLDAPRSSAASAPADLGGMTDDQLIARLTEHLRFLIAAKDYGAQPCHPKGVDGGPAPVEHAAPAAGPRVKADEPTVDPAPEPICEFCHQSPTRCAEIRETRPDTWEVLHRNDPIVAKKRDERATAEMFESLRRARMGGDPHVR